MKSGRYLHSAWSSYIINRLFLSNITSHHLMLEVLDLCLDGIIYNKLFYMRHRHPMFFNFFAAAQQCGTRDCEMHREGFWEILKKAWYPFNDTIFFIYPVRYSLVIPVLALPFVFLICKTHNLTKTEKNTLLICELPVLSFIILS